MEKCHETEGQIMHNVMVPFSGIIIQQSLLFIRAFFNFYLEGSNFGCFC